MDSRLLDRALKMLKEREMEVYLAAGREEAVKKISEIIRSGPVALSSGEYIAGMGLEEMLRSRNIEVIATAGDSTASCSAGGGGCLARVLEGAAWGVTGAAAVAADTGSIVILEDGGNGHMVSALPPAHLVVAGTGSIVPTLEDALSLCRELSLKSLGRPLARHISIISGPSMTADIQGILVKGMHGPLEVHVVLVREGE